MELISQRLYDAIERVLHATRGFNERTQVISCRICRSTDPLTLHDPTCPIYKLHDAWEHTFVREHPPATRHAPTEELDTSF